MCEQIPQIVWGGGGVKKRKFVFVRNAIEKHVSEAHSLPIGRGASLPFRHPTEKGFTVHPR